MKLKIEEFDKIANEKGYRTGKEFLIALGGGQSLYTELKKGKGICYDMVKNIYNCLGEYRTTQVIDFEEETMGGFKAKYIRIGTRLF